MTIRHKINNYLTPTHSHSFTFIFLDHFKKGHSDKGHKIEKKGSEEEKHTKFFDEDGDEAHDEKKGKIKTSINHTRQMNEIFQHLMLWKI